MGLLINEGDPGDQQPRPPKSTIQDCYPRAIDGAQRSGERRMRLRSDGTLVWFCDQCGDPVEDGDGTVWMDHRDARKYREHRDERETMTLKELLAEDSSFTAILERTKTEPQPARWRVQHYRCDTDGSEGGVFIYWFAVERIRTVARMLDWTGHLMGKVWFKDTDWDSLVREAAVEVGA